MKWHPHSSLLLLTLLLTPGCQTTHPQPTPPPAFKWSNYGATQTVHKSILVRSGQTLDGRLPDGKLTRLIAGSELGDGSQKEGQRPVVMVEAGGTIKHFILDFPAADGIHLECASGKVTRVLGCEFRDVGEDAVTVRGDDGKVIIEDCQFQHATDKVLQINGEAQVLVKDCRARKFLTFARGCGTCGPLRADITLSRPVGIEGETILKLSTAGARGRVEGGRFWDVKTIASASGGAEIKVTP